MKKYEFTGKTMEYKGYTLHQIRALRALYIADNLNPNVTTSISVNVGDIGGWILSEENLSHEGNCWVDRNVKIYGYASIEDNAYVGGEAIVCGATISGKARVVGNADVRGFTKIFGNALIGESALVKGRSKIYGNATIMGTAKVADSDISGSATIRGMIEVNCKIFKEGLYDCEDDFREKAPESRSYEKVFIPVDKHLSSVERTELNRHKNQFIWFLANNLR